MEKCRRVLRVERVILIPMARIKVSRVSEIPAGESKIVRVGENEIGIFNVNGRYVALQNRCPHQGAPLCRGQITGTNLPSKPGDYSWDRDGEIIRCPWHGWEFDLLSGCALADESIQVKTFPVEVEGEDFVLITK